MTPPPLGRRGRGRASAVSAVAALLVGALLLTGCGESSKSEAGGSKVGANAKRDNKPGAPSKTREEPSTAGDGSESLPPGDPGVDAPAVPDPGTSHADPHEESGRTEVPLVAMLTAEDVRMALGGRWERKDGGGDECLRLGGALAQLTTTYGGAGVDGLLFETVATYPDVDEADAAVIGLADVAAKCGWSSEPDPRLGTASVAARDGERALVAVSAEEGVAVVLVGSGEAVRDAGRWGWLVDLAMGSSCPAAPDGCH